MDKKKEKMYSVDDARFIDRERNPKWGIIGEDYKNDKHAYENYYKWQELNDKKKDKEIAKCEKELNSVFNETSSLMGTSYTLHKYANYDGKGNEREEPYIRSLGRTLLLTLLPMVLFLEFLLVFFTKAYNNEYSLEGMYYTLFEVVPLTNANMPCWKVLLYFGCFGYVVFCIIRIIIRNRWNGTTLGENAYQIYTLFYERNGYYMDNGVYMEKRKRRIAKEKKEVQEAEMEFWKENCPKIYIEEMEERAAIEKRRSEYKNAMLDEQAEEVRLNNLGNFANDLEVYIEREKGNYK